MVGGARVVDRSGSRFGLTDQQWVQAKEEVREAIVDAAYDRAHDLVRRGRQ